MVIVHWRDSDDLKKNHTAMKNSFSGSRVPKDEVTAVV